LLYRPRSHCRIHSAASSRRPTRHSPHKRGSPHCLYRRRASTRAASAACMRSRVPLRVVHHKSLPACGPRAGNRRRHGTKKRVPGNGPRDRGRVAHVAFNNLDIEAREIDPPCWFSATKRGHDSQTRSAHAPRRTQRSPSSRDQNLVRRALPPDLR